MGVVRGGQEMSSSAMSHILAGRLVTRRNWRGSTTDTERELLAVWRLGLHCAEDVPQCDESGCESASMSQVRPVVRYYSRLHILFKYNRIMFIIYKVMCNI